MIKNAEIVGSDILPARYNAETAVRGSWDLFVRAHILAEILRNAQRWVLGYESPESKAKEFGSLYDCLLLTPTQYPKRYCMLPPDPPRRPSDRQREATKPSQGTLDAIAWWDKWKAEHDGLETIDQHLSASVHGAIKRLREDKLIADLIDCSRKSLMIVAEWHDKATGFVIPLKCLIDVAPPSDHPIFSNSLWDAKSTRNASPKEFSKDAQRYHYNLQGAFYLAMWNAATGEERSDFGHIVQESYHPYEYRTPPPVLSRRFLDFGRMSYQAALEIYCKALSTGAWPSYDRRNAKEWPLTDCADWFLNPEALYPPLDEPEEDLDEGPLIGEEAAP